MVPTSTLAPGESFSRSLSLQHMPSNQSVYHFHIWPRYLENSYLCAHFLKPFNSLRCKPNWFSYFMGLLFLVEVLQSGARIPPASDGYIIIVISLPLVGHHTASEGRVGLAWTESLPLLPILMWLFLYIHTCKKSVVSLQVILKDRYSLYHCSFDIRARR